jgi:hypothetical protein
MRVAASSPAWLTRSWELIFVSALPFDIRVYWVCGAYGAG